MILRLVNAISPIIFNHPSQSVSQSVVKQTGDTFVGMFIVINLFWIFYSIYRFANHNKTNSLKNSFLLTFVRDELGFINVFNIFLYFINGIVILFILGVLVSKLL